MQYIKIIILICGIIYCIAALLNANFALFFGALFSTLAIYVTFSANAIIIEQQEDLYNLMSKNKANEIKRNTFTNKASKPWKCPRCGVINEPNATVCDCGSPRF